MSPESSKFIGDILYSIEMIELHLKGIKSFSEYTSNLTTIEAVKGDWR
jgi:hypothetical protein